MASSVRISKTDKANLVSYITDEQRTRANSTFRKDSERLWAEIDRQVAMKAPVATPESGQGQHEDWHNSVQLGHLADAKEIRTADVMRLVFPLERKWFHPHVEIITEKDPETGHPLPVDPKQQRKADGMVRSLMVQQNSDFGLRDRVRLSIGEALVHGGFVAMVNWQTQKKFHDGSRLETLSAPVWNVYSMWDSFPDPSPEVQGTDLFYQGSMICKKTWRAAKARKMPGWNAKMIKEDKNGMTDLLFFWGDAVITRSMSDLWIPNRFIVTSGDNIVYTAVNETPYSPIIYTGYEKDDPRNPYYTSPLIKRSPSLTVATRSANKFLDAVDLTTEPPAEYDTMSYLNGEPDLSPKAMNASRGGNGTRTILVADPGPALQGLQIGIAHIEQGTAVDQVRSGVSPGTEQTATEVVETSQRAEVREVEFVGILERQALLPFLYMQHDLNKKHLDNYPFYNDERTTPDFLRASKGNLPKHGVRYEITGSKQILGELERQKKFLSVSSFVLQNELLADRVDIEEVVTQAYADTGIKDPDRFIRREDDDEESKLQQVAQQAQQQVMEEMQPQIEKIQSQLAQAQAQTEVGMQRVQLEAQLKEERLKLDAEESSREQDRKDTEMQREQDRKDAETKAKIEQDDALVRQKLDLAEADAMAKELAGAKESEAKEQPKEERIVNVNTGTGSKVVTLTRAGNTTRAEVRSLDEDSSNGTR